VSGKKVMRVVMRADQSPMNFRRWNLLLDCGHDIWITRVTRPQAHVSKAPCAECAKAKR